MLIMSAKKRLYIILCASLFIHPVSAQQDTLFSENFDATPGSKPFGWTTELEAGDSKWQFVNGGGTKNPEIPGSRKPPAAYSDTVNALYFYESLEGEHRVGGARLENTVVVTKDGAEIIDHFPRDEILVAGEIL